TLGYKRDKYMTVDVEAFTKYQLYLMDIFLVNNIVCFAYDWEYAEDHPDETFRPWSTYDHYDIEAKNWICKIKKREYDSSVSLATDYMTHAYNPWDEFTHLPPPPNIHLFTWVSLHCLLLNITYKNIFTAKVTYQDNNPLNLSKFNLSVNKEHRQPGVYIR